MTHFDPQNATPGTATMSTPMRWAILVYGVVCYLAFHVSFVWLVLFLNDVPIVPTINSGTSRQWAAAIGINLGLVLLFGLQHSVMARRSFKQAWTKVIPEPAERPTFVLATAACLIAAYLFWSPMTAEIWRFDQPAAVYTILGIQAVGWLILVGATFALNHFHLFGLTQAWSAFPEPPCARPRVPHAMDVPRGSAPDPARHPARHLGSTSHDGRALCVRDRHDSLHVRRPLLRRTRSCSPVRPALCYISPECAKGHPTTVAVSLGPQTTQRPAEARRVVRGFVRSRHGSQRKREKASLLVRRRGFRILEEAPFRSWLPAQGDRHDAVPGSPSTGEEPGVRTS